MALETFEQMVAAAYVSGNYKPVWKKLVNTKFLVPIFPVIDQQPGEASKDIQFFVSDSEDGKPLLRIAEKKEKFEASDVQDTLELSGARIVTMVQAETDICVALSDRDLRIPATMVAKLKDLVLVAREKKMVQQPSPTMPPQVESVAVAGGFPQINASFSEVGRTEPVQHREPIVVKVLEIEPIERKPQSINELSLVDWKPEVKPEPEKSESGVVLGLAPTASEDIAPNRDPLVPVTPTRQGPRQAGYLDVAALRPRHFVNDPLGVEFYIPADWQEKKNARSILIVDPLTNTQLEITGLERENMTLDQWGEMRLPIVLQEKPFLQQVGDSYRLTGEEWGSRIQGLAVEYKGIFPGDDEERCHMVCCLRTDQMLIALTITTKSEVFEKNWALYKWLLSRVDIQHRFVAVSAKMSNGVRSNKQEDLHEEDDAVGQTAFGQKMMLYPVIGFFVMGKVATGISFHQGDGGSLNLAFAVLFLIFFLGASSLVGLWRIASGLGFSLPSRILVMISYCVPLLSFITLVVMSRKASAQIRAAGYHVGFVGAKESIPYRNNDLRNIFFVGCVLMLPFFALTHYHS